ncbi:hypothetical protein PLCT2_02568 [Planctomycetaceae bacterium]|nr:hypothetical protein PLCT2_02568 [Planctomycetaceae bacterium]
MTRKALVIRAKSLKTCIAEEHKLVDTAIGDGDCYLALHSLGYLEHALQELAPARSRQMLSQLKKRLRFSERDISDCRKQALESFRQLERVATEGSKWEAEEVMQVLSLKLQLEMVDRLSFELSGRHVLKTAELARADRVYRDFANVKGNRQRLRSALAEMERNRGYLVREKACRLLHGAASISASL